MTADSELNLWMNLNDCSALLPRAMIAAAGFKANDLFIELFRIVSAGK